MARVSFAQINAKRYIPEDARVRIAAIDDHPFSKDLHDGVALGWNRHLVAESSYVKPKLCVLFEQAFDSQTDPHLITLPSFLGVHNTLANVTNYSEENSWWKNFTTGKVKHIRVDSLANFLEHVGRFLLASGSEDLMYCLQTDFAFRYGSKEIKPSYGQIVEKDYPLKRKLRTSLRERVEDATKSLSERITTILEDEEIEIDTNSQLRVETRQARNGPLHLIGALDIAYNHDQLGDHGRWYRYTMRIEARGRR